jgi:lysyl-tRNA synthetase class 1
MFWVDEIVEDILQKHPGKKDFIIRDEKTLSGRVHVGSVRGVVIHGVVAQALREKGFNARFIFEFNDVDPLDGLPEYLDKNEYSKYMGMPLRDIPSPDGKAKNFAEFWGQEFLSVINGLGFYPEIVRAGELYDSGVYNSWIEKIVNHPKEIRAIYKEVSGSEKPDDWYPLQVVCEECGKVGSTKVTGWDGSLVSYVCEPDMVTWAKGCGKKGAVSPFNGRGKLPWKVEWPVKWAGNKVDVEGSGKDHNAAGGSHDIGERVCREILEAPVPYNIPYEFFLVGGAKMSSSKGEGSSAKEVFDSLPAELLRFLMVKTKPNQPIEFSLSGNTIPRLFDQYDDAADHFFSTEKTFPDLDRLFHFSQLDQSSLHDHFRPRFSRVSFLVQMPHLDYLKEIEKMKGSPLKELDMKEAENRQTFAKMWLSNFAPEEFIFEIHKSIPDIAYNLSSEQKEFLKNLAELLKNNELQDEALHGAVHELRKSSTLEARDGFSAIYASLLGKTSGPQAGWFLTALDRHFLINRFVEVSKLAEKPKPVFADVKSPLLTISSKVVEKFPDIHCSWSLVTGIQIGEKSHEITQLVDELLKSTNFSDLKKNSEKLQAYKNLYKMFGVDPTKRKPSPVALVDRLVSEKPFPRINDLVDLYNVLSVRHQFAIGAFDADKVKLPLVLRFATHQDQFQGLGTDIPKKLEAGELCYFDASDLCIARDFNHYDSELSKVDSNTVNVLLNVDGTALHSLEEMKLITEELNQAVINHFGGQLQETHFVCAREGVTLP